MEKHGDYPFPGTYLSSAKITITKPPLCRREWHTWTVSETSSVHAVVSGIHAEGHSSAMQQSLAKFAAFLLFLPEPIGWVRSHVDAAHCEIYRNVLTVHVKDMLLHANTSSSIYCSTASVVHAFF